MKVLVVNCGSSSIKYKLYDMTDHSVLASGGIEKVGLPGSFLKASTPDGGKAEFMHECPDHSEGIKFMFEKLLDKSLGGVDSLSEIDAVGHRIVAGGTYTKSQIVDEKMLEGWKPFMQLAPLHSGPHLKGYVAVKEQLPELPQVFVFDTAFHQTMPSKAYMYALPYKYYEEMNIRRYGAHGTSHRYVTLHAKEVFGKDASELKLITCHIGNGASISAVDHGKCVDTSMGLTPLEGVMMGTRTGDIDSSAVLYIMEKEALSPEQGIELLNKKSGLLGISGVSSDMREVREAAAEGNDRAQLALDMYNYRIKKYIGAYAAAMGGVDAIIFTAGVGEHVAPMRAGALEGLEFLGVKVDAERNAAAFGTEAIISTDDSRVKVAVVPTDEELMIASDTMELVMEANKK